MHALLRSNGQRTAQHSTAQHSTAQHSTAQHSTAQHSTAQRFEATQNKVVAGHCYESLDRTASYAFGRLAIRATEGPSLRVGGRGCVGGEGQVQGSYSVFLGSMQIGTCNMKCGPLFAFVEGL